MRQEWHETGTNVDDAACQPGVGDQHLHAGFQNLVGREAMRPLDELFAA
jgi:hypothetical protein